MNTEETELFLTLEHRVEESDSDPFSEELIEKAETFLEKDCE